MIIDYNHVFLSNKGHNIVFLNSQQRTIDFHQNTQKHGPIPAQNDKFMITEENSTQRECTF